MDPRPTSVLIRDLIQSTATWIRSEAREAVRRSSRATLGVALLVLGSFALMCGAILSLGRALGDRFDWSAWVIGAALAAAGGLAIAPLKTENPDER